MHKGIFLSPKTRSPMVERSVRGEKRMNLRLRQIAGVAGDLSTVEQQICRVLGVEVCYEIKGLLSSG